ncbi:hypothetical protein [Salinirussus salinus]|uniref:hypothetical protein n=1 Tax=Salinirussus salinus TaxID=1198300 RepID=UPI00135C4EAC|nr:hypothetical protein [Salinirussus salinus]
MTNQYSRRSLISALVASGAVATAGCSSLTGGGDGGESPTVDDPADAATPGEADPTETPTAEPTDTATETEERTPTPEPTPALETLGDRIFAQEAWFFDEQPRQRAVLNQLADDLLSRVDEFRAAPADVTTEDVETLVRDVDNLADRLSAVGTEHYTTGEDISIYERPFKEFYAEKRTEAASAIKEAIEFQDTDTIKKELNEFWRGIPDPGWSTTDSGAETTPGTVLNIYSNVRNDSFDDHLLDTGIFRLPYLVLGNLEGKSFTVTWPDLYFPRRDERLTISGGLNDIETLRSRAGRYRQPFETGAAVDELFWTAKITGDRFDNRFSEGHLYQFSDDATAAETYSSFIDAVPTEGTAEFKVGTADKVGLVSEGGGDTLYAYSIQRGSYVLIFNGHVQRWEERGFKNDIGLWSYRGEL